MKTMKRVGLVMMVLAVLVVSAGAVAAQGRGPGGDGPGGPRDRMEQFRERGMPVRGVLNTLGEIIAAETGLTTDEIAEQVRAGESLAVIIEANGGSVDNVIAEATTRAETYLAEQVEAGRITDEQAETRLNELVERLPEFLAREFDGRGMGDRDWRPVQRGLLERVTEATGLTPEEVQTQLRDGQSISEILSASGVNIDAFIADTLAAAETEFAAAVAEGRITEERAAQMLATLTERLPELLEREFQGGPRRGRNSI